MQNENNSQLSGVSEIFGFGKTFQFAVTHDEAVQNVYVRANYNKNAASKNTFNTEYFSKKLIGAIIYEYRTLASARIIPYYDNHNDKATRHKIVQQIAVNLKISSDVVDVILLELFGNVRWSRNTAEIILSPGADKKPTAAQRANFEAQEADRELREKAAAIEKANPGFWERIGTSITDLWGAPGKGAQGLATVLPYVAVAAVGTGLYVFYRKTKELDVNGAVRQASKVYSRR